MFLIYLPFYLTQSALKYKDEETFVLHSTVTGFWIGFSAPAKALRRIVSSPRLLALVAVPLAINLCLYVLFFKYGAQYLNSEIANIHQSLSVALPPWLLTISHWALRLLSWLLLALVAALTFTFVSGLIAAPFNDLLSRNTLKIELAARGIPLSASPLNHGLKDTIWLELKRMGILVCGAILAAILALIPFLQLPALILGAFLVAFEYFGYPIAIRSPSLVPIGLFILRHPAISMGFGSFLLLMMALPFTSIFYIPLAVVGGTMLYAKLAYLQNG